MNFVFISFLVDIFKNNNKDYKFTTEMKGEEDLKIEVQIEVLLQNKNLKLKPSKKFSNTMKLLKKLKNNY